MQNIFELFEDVLQIDTISSNHTELQTTNQYMKKGERILSLLKSKKQDKAWSDEGFLSIFNAKSVRNHQETDLQLYKYICRQTKKKILEPIIKKMEQGHCINMQELCELTGNFYMPGEFIPVHEKYYHNLALSLTDVQTKEKAGFYALYKVKKGDKWVYLLFCENGRLLDKVNKYLYREKNDKEHGFVRFSNVADFFVKEVLFNQMYLEFWKSLSLESDRDKDSFPAYHYLQTQARDFFDSHLVDGVLPLSLQQQNYFKWLEQLGYKKEIHEKSKFIIPCIFHFLFPKDKEPFKNMMITVFDQVAVSVIFKSLFRVFDEEREQIRLSNHFLREHAKSFETKKNIPEYIQKAMEKSDFNSIFGYVEFDKDCELEKLDVIEREWHEICKTYGFVKDEQLSLRFRRLGNHHAAGLYFPSFKCICVDLRYPSSMLHEYFHYLDFENGHLSSQTSFQKIYEAYEERIVMVTKGKKLSGKYNLNYYLQPTEVFARCGELYSLYFVNIESSLLKIKDELSFAYPLDEEFLSMIKEYFDDFMSVKRVGAIA